MPLMALLVLALLIVPPLSLPPPDPDPEPPPLIVYTLDLLTKSYALAKSPDLPGNPSHLRSLSFFGGFPPVVRLPDPPDPPDGGRSFLLPVTPCFVPLPSPQVAFSRHPSHLLCLSFPSLRSPPPFPSVLPLHRFQVCYCLLPCAESTDMLTLPIYSDLIASVRLFTVICSSSSSLAIVMDNLKFILPDVWQFGVNIPNLHLILAGYSFVEFVSLPNVLFGSSVVIAGSWSSKASSTSSFGVGLVTRCFVILEFNVVFLIVKHALDAFSISGLGLLNVSNNSHGIISLHLTVVVEFRGHLFGFGVSSVMIALIHNIVVVVSISVWVVEECLAGMAWLSCIWNIFSFIGE
ncbi:unnamed protein product [Microthlaspi erraticum]|uniref:Uncharacterized protein n=1 Tax=Microthlaspi erraticum TaxID=1685480 RepID=A0A6D2K255_9BRAS|nr:unnamed protein product [Microthlaspi erraticum]